MADQSNDVPQTTYNDEFKSDFHVGDLSSSDTTLPSPAQSSEDLFSNEDVTSASLNEQTAIASVRDDHVDGGSFPEQSSEAVRNRKPDNEVTVTTTPSDVDISNTEAVADTSSEPDLDDSEHHAEETSLLIFSESIAESIMAVRTHPPANFRLDYESDGRRRYFRDPMVIDQPVSFQFVDSKTITFTTPPCLIEANENHKIEVPIVVRQNNRETTRVSFYYEPCE
ncbi:unnamed protein product [Adineta steineri]|uniref:Uncharacterized protein n=1 Tax=Adineta steineri TaxID=433720 RepID=A0A814R862_9BILA|nr:unnamed protein product [Adineta steineri]CAF1129931.1 unnamed protein product [Adineta steineri]